MISVLAVLVLAGDAALVVSLVALHVLPTGLSPLRDPVSQYAITRYGAGYRAATLAAAVAGGFGAWLVAAALSGPTAVATAVLLVVFAVARLLIGFFRMDAPGSSRTGTGRAHNLLAVAAFGTVTAAAFVAGGALHDAGHSTLATLSTVTGVVMAAGAVGMLLTGRVPAARGLFGAAERLIYLGFIAFFVLVGILGLSG